MTLSQDRSSSEKIYKVTDNGTYIFRITGNNGRRIKVQCTVTNAIPIKQDLLTAIADINMNGISKCKVIGKTGDTAKEETEIYSLDTIYHEGNLELDGVSSVNDIKPGVGKTYELGYTQDVSDGTNYAQNTVVLKVIGDLVIKEGVTVTSISGAIGGPKGMIIYCTGTLTNNGTITMEVKGAYSKGQNVFLYKNSNETYEFIPRSGSKGGEGALSTVSGLIYGEVGENGKGRRNCWW